MAKCPPSLLIICICLSVPTNNETENLVLLQKHVVLMRNIQYDSVWKLFYYNKSRGVVLTSLCVRVMCVRDSIKAVHIYIYIYIYKLVPPNVQDMVTALGWTHTHVELAHKAGHVAMFEVKRQDFLAEPLLILDNKTAAILIEWKQEDVVWLTSLDICQTVSKKSPFRSGRKRYL